MTNTKILPQHVLGGIAFEARAIFSGIDAHASGAPISIDALNGAIARMQGLAGLISNPTVAPAGEPEVSPKPKRARRRDAQKQAA